MNLLSKTQMREVVRALRPNITDDEFNRLWASVTDRVLTTKHNDALRRMNAKRHR